MIILYKMPTNNKDYMKEYYHKHSKKFISPFITCDCGCIIRKANLKYHQTTKKHLLLLLNLSS